MLDDWQDAPALVLSCPGPLRRHAASLMALEQMALAQVFLGGESQLLAFAAAFPKLSGKMFFTALPEMFSAAAGWRGVWRGVPPERLDRVVHLRFGPARDARVLKGVRNVAVVAEAPCPSPVLRGRHPFASGDVLPAAMAGVLTYGEAGAAPSVSGGERLPVRVLPAACVTADLVGAGGTRRGGAGLDLVALGDFNASAWADGEIGRDRLRGKQSGVLIPWNVSHPGGIVPELLERLVSLQNGEPVLPRLLVLPFNDGGENEAIRALIERLGAAAARAADVLERVFVARVTAVGGLAALRDVALRAWVDGGDPEAWWTLARLRAAGFAPLVLGAGRGDLPGFAADDAVELESLSRFGTLRFTAALPAVRDLAALVATAVVDRPARSGRRA